MYITFFFKKKTEPKQNNHQGPVVARLRYAEVSKET
jgi:hypothetical protein